MAAGEDHNFVIMHTTNPLYSSTTATQAIGHRHVTLCPISLKTPG